MTTVRLLCHASGWCNQSRNALAEMIKHQEQSPGTVFAVRWDGGGYPYSATQDADPSVKYLAQVLVEENKAIFTHLYKIVPGDGFNVPMEFNGKASPRSLMAHKQGYTKGHFVTSVFPKLQKDSKNMALIPGKFTLFYMQECEHVGEYLPLWDRIQHMCQELRTGFYSFETKVYNKNNNELRDLIGGKITDLPIVVFQSDKHVAF